MNSEITEALCLNETIDVSCRELLSISGLSADELQERVDSFAASQCPAKWPHSGWLAVDSHRPVAAIDRPSLGRHTQPAAILIQK